MRKFIGRRKEQSESLRNTRQEPGKDTEIPGAVTLPEGSRITKQEFLQ